MTLPHMPPSIKNGLIWVASSWGLAIWLGVTEAPWASVAKQREAAEVVAERVAERVSRQGESILVLQERERQTQQSLDRITAKLDEMSMVLYSMERRTR